MENNEKQTAVEWLVEQYKKVGGISISMAEKAKEMEKEQMGYSGEDVIKIVEKSRETGLTAEYLLLTYEQQG